MRVLIILWIAVLFVGCSGNKKETTQRPNLFYTCSMHPQIMEPKPGKCPICHMDLIPVKNTNQHKTNEIHLTEQQIRLGNIRVDTIGSGNIANEMVLNATLSMDQSKINAVSARVAGRIERLYFKNVGDFVPKGAKLYELYSEELNNAKQEYRSALEKKQLLDNSIIDFDRLIQSAKNRLLLWGMSEAQVRELSKSKNTNQLTVFYSTASGYITSLDITEGEYIMEGGTVVNLANLSTLWAEVQLYSSQLSYIDQQAAAIVRFPDIPGKILEAKVDFQNPEINTNSRINLLRVTIPNIGDILKPGMAAYVTIKNANRNSLLLPIDAVLRDNKGASVWIKTGTGSFVNKMVEPGLETNGFLEIKSGLKTGDIVVISGAYLINSEYIFKQGADPMANMEHR